MTLTEKISTGSEDGLPHVAKLPHEFVAGCVIVGGLALSIGFGLWPSRGFSPDPPGSRLETKIAALDQINAPRAAIYGRLHRPLHGPAYH
jgi:hypothetical protein